MKKKKETVAMILAGGQGNRLGALTSTDAKPSVSFGGKYRIIDFVLSNCANSGIDTIGILTQYQPLTLNEYIGNGQPWDLDRSTGGVQILPPYQSKSTDWYKGTANAIYQNLNFIEKYSPQFVLVLSGDHIYKMDYSKLIEYHKSKNASCTIAVKEVNLKEARRFGIMTYDYNFKINSFEEKPEIPKGTSASMGIYVFSTDTLMQYLKQDNENDKSSKDFGKDIIPHMINNNESVFAYTFDGYWKDVGTVESLWEANMDMLGDSPVFSTADRQWKIRSRSNAEPPQFVGGDAKIVNSNITEGCIINGTVENSVIAQGVYIARGARVVDSVIFDRVKILEGASVIHSIVDADSVIGKGATVGREDYLAPITVINKSAQVNDGDKIV
ncbi:MAG: glucose-1-phosphate adenylyltransferase [Clostridia bacterium]|nr:glucose-1-phosphate adenylyltransferase [Clostridia bacterium]